MCCCNWKISMMSSNLDISWLLICSKKLQLRSPAKINSVFSSSTCSRNLRNSEINYNLNLVAYTMLRSTKVCFSAF